MYVKQYFVCTQTLILLCEIFFCTSKIDHFILEKIWKYFSMNVFTVLRKS